MIVSELDVSGVTVCECVCLQMFVFVYGNRRSVLSHVWLCLRD